MNMNKKRSAAHMNDMPGFDTTTKRPESDSSPDIQYDNYGWPTDWTTWVTPDERKTLTLEENKTLEKLTNNESINTLLFDQQGVPIQIAIQWKYAEHDKSIWIPTKTKYTTTSGFVRLILFGKISMLNAALKKVKENYTNNTSQKLEQVWAELQELYSEQGDINNESKQKEIFEDARQYLKVQKLHSAIKEMNSGAFRAANDAASKRITDLYNRNPKPSKQQKKTPITLNFPKSLDNDTTSFLKKNDAGIILRFTKRVQKELLQTGGIVIKPGHPLIVAFKQKKKWTPYVCYLTQKDKETCLYYVEESKSDPKVIELHFEEDSSEKPISLSDYVDAIERQLDVPPNEILEVLNEETKQWESSSFASIIAAVSSESSNPSESSTASTTSGSESSSDEELCAATLINMYQQFDDPTDMTNPRSIGSPKDSGSEISITPTELVDDPTDMTDPPSISSPKDSGSEISITPTELVSDSESSTPVSIKPKESRDSKSRKETAFNTLCTIYNITTDPEKEELKRKLEQYLQQEDMDLYENATTHTLEPIKEETIKQLMFNAVADDTTPVMRQKDRPYQGTLRIAPSKKEGGGYGVFTTEAIKKGTILGFYSGKIIPTEEAHKTEGDYVFHTDEVTIDAVNIPKIKSTDGSDQYDEIKLERTRKSFTQLDFVSGHVSTLAVVNGSFDRTKTDSPKDDAAVARQANFNERFPKRARKTPTKLTFDLTTPDGRLTYTKHNLSATTVPLRNGTTGIVFKTIENIRKGTELILNYGPEFEL